MHSVRTAQTVSKKVISPKMPPPLPGKKIVLMVLPFQASFVGTYSVAKSLCSIGRWVSSKDTPCLCGSVLDRNGLPLFTDGLRGAECVRVGILYYCSKLCGLKRRLLRCAAWSGSFLCKQAALRSSLHPPWSIFSFTSQLYCMSSSGDSVPMCTQTSFCSERKIRHNVGP